MSNLPFEGWVLLELMGHRKLGGFAREVSIAGSGFVRIDVPSKDGAGNVATQFYAPDAVYCITPVEESVARRFAAGCQPEPVTRWELPAIAAQAPPEDDADEEDEP